MSKRMLQKHIKVIENKTFWFIFPMLGTSITEFINFRGCFIGSTDYPHYDSHIFLLIKWDSDLEARDFEYKLKNKDNYIANYQPDKFHTMYIFHVPKEYLEEYDSVLNGKYSKLSINYKKHIIKFHNIKGLHQLPQILYKDPRLRKDLEERLGISIPEENELSSIFDIAKEIYTEDMKILVMNPNLDALP